jgi:hypothetical protein
MVMASSQFDKSIIDDIKKKRKNARVQGDQLDRQTDDTIRGVMERIKNGL